MKYRFLKEGEIIKKQDEYLLESNLWIISSRIGKTVRCKDLRYRRRIDNNHPQTNIFK